MFRSQSIQRGSDKAEEGPLGDDEVPEFCWPVISCSVMSDSLGPQGL